MQLVTLAVVSFQFFIAVLLILFIYCCCCCLSHLLYTYIYIYIGHMCLLYNTFSLWWFSFYTGNLHKRYPIIKRHAVQYNLFFSVRFLNGIALKLICSLRIGNGKTHYIKEQLSASAAQLTIAVNEAFTPLKVIIKLCSLPTNVWGANIFFNFTMLSPRVRDTSKATF